MLFNNQRQAIDAYFEKYFVIRSPDATNVWVAAGLYEKGSSASAAGFSRDQALAGMLGEFCEREALATYQAEAGVSGPPVVAVDQPITPSRSSRLARSINMATGEPCLIPVEYLRPAASSGRKQSEGCGAGATIETAQLHGLMELVERDALALWWHCGRRGRIITNSASFVNELLGLGRDRDTHLLDITSDLMIPTIVAASFDAQGRMFTSGVAAASTAANAAKSALKEMVQMEFGHHLIREKLHQKNLDALSAHERLVLERASRIDRAELIGSATCGETTFDQLAEAPASANALARQLADFNIRAYAVDLGVGVAGLYVAKIVSPDLVPGTAAPGATRLPQRVAGLEGACGLAYF